VAHPKNWDNYNVNYAPLVWRDYPPLKIETTTIIIIAASSSNLRTMTEEERKQDLLYVFGYGCDYSLDFRPNLKLVFFASYQLCLISSSQKLYQ